MKRLLSMGNSDLRRDRIWTWSLPAWVVDMPDGTKMNVCPSAGSCADFCYARKGTYRFSNVRQAHMRNLQMTLHDLDGWRDMMICELRHARFDGAHIRIHDSGDFYSEAYLQAWLDVMRATPAATFYAYTKEVAAFKRLVEPDSPTNFRWIYSRGGRYDHLIADDDRQADVFGSPDELAAAGYADQEASDLLAIYGPPKVGIVVNDHPGARRKLGVKSFGTLQAGRHSKDAA